MPEQGPTDHEVAFFLNAVNEATGGPGCACNYDGPCDTCYRRGLGALDALTRARHIREAVEEIDDRDLWDAIEAGGFGDGNLRAFRAALLNILLNKQ